MELEFEIQMIINIHIGSILYTLIVSKLGYGCMGLSGAYNSPVSDEDGIAIIKYAFSKDIYGVDHSNEILLGRIMLSLTCYFRSRIFFFFLATAPHRPKKQALEKCQLKATINSLPNLLDSSVLLRRNKIIVLDEATDSIDSATDATLHRMITVAHRVPTIIDSDMVMLINVNVPCYGFAGELVEYDDPSKLRETNSSFSKLEAEYWSSYRRNSVLL
ncbi:hypothetical protein HYC85_028125 [Camellia sinensis]|uniref:ABC transporter domain-containing protein n=1 Tax=Camellia sinensis TaxID=4442 RepID=A0A7J7FYA1_CAMSI|nr:hypothetical protein HYC85_028125 [Camellia sinensis]